MRRTPLRLTAKGSTTFDMGTRGPGDSPVTSTTASRSVTLVRRPCRTMLKSPTHDTAARASPSQPGQAERAPNHTSTPTSTIWRARWKGASSMVSHDAKKLGASSTRLRDGQRALMVNSRSHTLNASSSQGIAPVCRFARCAANVCAGPGRSAASVLEGAPH